MTNIFRTLLFIISIASVTLLHAQKEYRYSVDLNKLENDTLTIELITPKLEVNTVTFSFPKIIPGTYAISDYGKFVSNVNAFDDNGRKLQVEKVSTDKWKILNAARLHKITYKLADIFDSEIKHGVYPMAATNFEESKNFVIHPPGFFGFFDGYNQLPFTVSINKPAVLYGSTSLTPVEQSPTLDVFKTSNVDELYDSPIMYTVPDTTTITVGNCHVLVSVYSPGHYLNSKQMAGWLGNMLNAAKQYLSGRLPANKYAFLYYFKDPKIKQSFPAGLGGALEHTTSSFYYFAEMPAEYLKNTLVDASSHEFFHIITPLTIASKEIKQFNYDEPVLSKHLWLYEGVTEYTAQHVQVKYGLTTIQQFLQALSQKITISRRDYNDALPFTIMSREAAGKYEKEYGNVYEKGALIGACLDVYLLHLSNGTYGLRNLTYDLGVRFGKTRYFNDDSLFSAIRELTFPEIEEFLNKYVAGSTPIPYEYYFSLAGIKFMPKAEKKVYSLGGINPDVNDKGVVIITSSSNFNEFGKKVGYRPGDELYAINGVALKAERLMDVIDSIKSAMRTGDSFTAKIGRKNPHGKTDTLTLRTTTSTVIQTELNTLEPVPNADSHQRLVQQAWLIAQNTTDNMAVADSNDVNSIDAIIKATYNVISGPAGQRDWNRFNSLFLPDAKMGASVTPVNGQPQYRSFTPTKYQLHNYPYFLNAGFYEEELKRNTMQFGNLATVESAYQYRLQPNGKVEQRGVNYFVLVYSSGRWWISNLLWQDESETIKLPKTLVK